MKDNKKLDYSFIIGLFLIFVVLTVFNFLSKNKKVFNNYNKKNIVLSINNKNRKKEKFYYLENEVLRIKVSNLGGIMNEIFLKKYQFFNKYKIHNNIFLVKNYNLLYRIFLSDNKGKNISTENLFFKPFLKKTSKNVILTMRYQNPYENNGFLDYIYEIDRKNNYHINFFIRTKNFKSFNNFVRLDWNHKIFPLEKDRNWENSYTQVCYLPKEKSNSIEYLSEKQTDEKFISKVKWIAFKQQFFTTIINPNNKILKNVFIYSKNHSEGKYLKTIHFNTDLSSNKDINISFKIYFGPLDLNILKKYKNQYENIIPFGWGFLKWINKYFFLSIFELLEKTNLNYGIIIILMTMVVKIILFPIIYKQHKLSIIMKLIRPDIEKLNKKFENKDMIEKQKAIMNLYKKVGISPMSGCLSALFQIPIFYSLFKFFPTLINLRGKSFLWVEDLTSYDSIIELPLNIPFYGDHVSLLTLLYVFALFIYTRISSQDNKNNFLSKDDNISSPNMDFMLYLMPFIMLLFINSYASALSLYYFISNIINIGFFFIIKKFIFNKKKILLIK